MRERINKNINVIDLKALPMQEKYPLIYVDGNHTSDKNHKPLTITQLAKKYGVNYLTAKKWKECDGNTKRKKRVRRDRKMTKEIKEFIKEKAGNKLTLIGNASPNALVSKIIKKFSKVDKPLTISTSCVRRHMNKILSKARKIRKSFLLTKNNVVNRKTYCDEINENSKYYQEIFFTDEKIFELEKYFHRGTNYIRLTKEFKKRLNQGDTEVEKLMTVSVQKFSKGFMVAGGISKFGPGKLIFISGNQDTKAYHKILKYYKEDIDFLNEKKKCNLLLQQDNAPTHTSNNSKKIIRDFFIYNLI